MAENDDLDVQCDRWGGLTVEQQFVAGFAALEFALRARDGHEPLLAVAGRAPSRADREAAP